MANQRSYEGFGEVTNPDGTPWYPPAATPGTPEFEQKLKDSRDPGIPPVPEGNPRDSMFQDFVTPTKQDDSRFFQSLMDAISGTTSKVGKASNGLGGKIANQREQVIDSYKSFVDKLIKIIK